MNKLKWYDANLIVESEVQRDKWEYERLMKEKPNFDKSKEKLKNIKKKEGKPLKKYNY